MSGEIRAVEVTHQSGRVVVAFTIAFRVDAASGTRWPDEAFLYDRMVDAVLAVPAVAEVFARDAKVREIVERVQQPDDEWGRPISYVYADGFDDIAALYGNTESHACYAALVADVQIAARVRALAARLDTPPYRSLTFTAAEVAAMLREAGE